MATNPLIQASATQILQQTLAAWGLSSLAGQLSKLLQEGYTSDTLSFALQDTPEYKARFAANAVRVKNGLPALSPAEYISLEEQYRQIGAQYGLPKGYFDSKQDIDNMIANDVSPTELDSRAQAAQQQYLNASPQEKQVWEQFYGLTPGAAVAAILNPSTPLSTLQNEAQTVQLGVAAKQAGLPVGVSTATQFQQAGVTLSQAQQAFQNIAATVQTQHAINNRFGGQQSLTDTQTSLENAALLNSGKDQADLERTNREEKALFSGAGGATTQSLTPDASQL